MWKPQKDMWDKHNSNWFAQNPQNAKMWKWRPLSFKKQFEDYLQSDWTIVIKKKNIKSIHKNGDISIKIPKKEMLVMKAVNRAMSNKWTESVKMIQWIIEKFDGKAMQPTETRDLTNDVNLDKIKDAL